MKKVVVILGIIVMIALVVGCAQEYEAPAKASDATPDIAESDTLEEIDETFVEDDELDVGDII